MPISGRVISDSANVIQSALLNKSSVRAMDGAPVILNASDAGGLWACERRHAVRYAHADSHRGAGFR